MQNHPSAKVVEIVDLAYDAFYNGGFFATSVDQLLVGSGISKRTLYRYFTSKADLVVAVLDQYTAELATFFDRIEAEEAGGARQIMGVFSRRAELLRKDWRGCLAMKAAFEYRADDVVISQKVRTAVRLVDERLARMCQRVENEKASASSRQIALLFHSALMLSHARRNTEPFEGAMAAVAVLTGMRDLDTGDAAAVDGTEAKFV